MRSLRFAVLLALLAASSAFRAGQSQPALDDVLRAAGTYLLKYEQAISVVVAEEDYLQVARSTAANLSSRRLRSDYLVLNMPDGWVGFRDVFEVDGRPVRDRQERLAALFLKPAAGTLAQAEQIAAEAARFNLSQSVSITRTINVPMTALLFLHPADQGRSTFRIDGHETLAGTECAIVRFTEQATPRLLATDNGSAASGAFWIEPHSGRIQRSELTAQTERRMPVSAVSRTRDELLAVRATIRVNYAEQPSLKLWLPVSMEEHYEVTPRNAIIDGRATYSKFRQFQVETRLGIKTP